MELDVHEAGKEVIEPDSHRINFDDENDDLGIVIQKIAAVTLGVSGTFSPDHKWPLSPASSSHNVTCYKMWTSCLTCVVLEFLRHMADTLLAITASSSRHAVISERPAIPTIMQTQNHSLAQIIVAHLELCLQYVATWPCCFALWPPRVEGLTCHMSTLRVAINHCQFPLQVFSPSSA